MAQPPLYPRDAYALHAAVGSLALGGAERIVLDWAQAASRTFAVRLIVLRPSDASWPIPAGISIVRLDPSGGLLDQLTAQGHAIAASGNPRVLCHLLRTEERNALARGGAQPVPVVHNARAGWLDESTTYRRTTETITVSSSAASELSAIGARATVIRHFPRAPATHADARRTWRTRWAIPMNAICIGMIGGVKPQKGYPQAFRLFAELRRRREAYLVILGGPIGRDGMLAWQAAVAQAARLGIADCVRMPGFVAEASRCAPAFDLLLNTSRYEGVSIATLEALAAGLPVVASDVGGQAEVASPGLHLLAPDAAPERWIATIEAMLGSKPGLPSWLGFPSARLWTLFHIAVPERRGGTTLFVTANLNAGGAQRSLVNLALSLRDRLPIEVGVCGDSSSSAFHERLVQGRVTVFRTAASRDCFDHAEALLRRMARGDIGNVVCWNLDPKIKLLLSKRLAGRPLRLIDVSPGDYAFEELDATRTFQAAIAHDARDYFGGLHRLVLKFRGRSPAEAHTVTIPNGVPLQALTRQISAGPRSVVVSGRIAPSKFILEIIAAMRTVRELIPDARLHILGTAEARHREYADRVMEAIGIDLGVHVIMHGAAFDAPERLAAFDIALVIGHHQGSPNAVLEAMAAGLVVVANDSGGTKEAVIDGRTGVLLQGREPEEIAKAILRLMNDARLAARLARRGHRHVRRRFSMQRMADAYRRLLAR